MRNAIVVAVGQCEKHVPQVRKWYLNLKETVLQVVSETDIQNCLLHVVHSTDPGARAASLQFMAHMVALLRNSRVIHHMIEQCLLPKENIGGDSARLVADAAHAAALKFARHSK